MRDVYITGTGRFLPGEAIDNHQMETYLGKIHGVSSRLMKPVLRKNGIQTRYYSITPDGNALFSNAEMAAQAIEQALESAQINKNKLEYLATSTTQGDLLVPGHGSSVHAALKAPPLEIASFQSVCASSVMALKSAYLNLKAEEYGCAAVCGSEFSSRWFKAKKYEDYLTREQAEKPPIETEFLRWTLSDGAGAAILSHQKNSRYVNLKIEWIEIKSYADKFSPCMYAGANTNNDDKKYWGLYDNVNAAAQDSAVVLKQDVDLLYQLFPVWVGFYLEILKKRNIDIHDIDYFLPHYSSASLKEEMKKLLRRSAAMIPENKWFNNLERFGNTGAASIFIILDDFIKNTSLKRGDKILCFVPESGQCMVSFFLLTVS